MKKVIIACSILFAFHSGVAQAATDCGEIDKLTVWATGGDKYGVRIIYKDNPEACSSGFFLPHVGDNKDLVYSLMLAAKFSNQKICIHSDPNKAGSKIDEYCKVNSASIR